MFAQDLKSSAQNDAAPCTGPASDALTMLWRPMPPQVRGARHEAACYARALAELEQEQAEPMSEVGAALHSRGRAADCGGVYTA